MKAAVFNQIGGPENIKIEEVAKPEIAPHQLLIKVKACALNHFDLLVLSESSQDDFTFPFWGGADIAGVLTEVGEAVNGFTLGDRVVVNPSLYCGQCEHCLAGEESQCYDYGIIGDSIPGGLAEYIAVDARNVLKLPEHMSFEDAAATPLVYQTAWRALITKACIGPGDEVLILGASGGVGSASIQIAKLAGAKVIAVTSNADKILNAKKMGADIVLDRKSGDYWKELASLTNNRGVDVVIENVGKATWTQSLNSLAKGGRLVTYGRTTGNIVETDIKVIFWNQLSIIGTTMASCHEFNKVMQLVFNGKLKPVIDSIFPLEEAAAAYQRLQDGEHFGKVIIQIDPT
ncbi:MAG: zinc-binding dehydrogenase [Gammaproteobacteria bacterium]|nr:zinc-binding dehydrogenase [Gammaproteobacteria bacterium]